MSISPMRIDEFRAGVAMLPAALARRAESLKLYATRLPRRPGCSGCANACESVRLAFAAVSFGDLGAADRLLSLAERSTRPVEHTTGCGRGGLRSVRGVPGRHGRVPVRWPATGPLTAATDASWKNRVGGLGYITSDGHWGLCGRPTDRHDPTGPAKVLVNELRAVDLLLRGAPGPDVLLVDSTGALELLRAWQRGEVERMPEGYDLRPRRCGPPALVRLAEHVAGLGGLSVRHVKGHSGHLLNEAADSLASIARRSVTERFDVTERAAGLVSSFLSSWHRLPAAA
ncbi:hypothetical protein [Streptosporangium pseudovulgare]|uniref:RNase H type-1 domain-containing protein n=1 Tax=Streptosporangium pseudovulgare TaxID=35765 RepID=A0ABQ2R2I3_9ACTN|nr:hypothetical protein [Streptosporangium pseudovulgare]GGQ07382.1 hypothetical protein GCM10010140_42010 [Streptosporangium pseudovulgare]